MAKLDETIGVMAVNNVGQGAIAGTGVGPQGEPGVKKQKRPLRAIVQTKPIRRVPQIKPIPTAGSSGAAK